LLVGVDALGQVAGVGAQQIVEGIPAGGCSTSRLAWVSSVSTGRIVLAGSPARLAAAAVAMSGPGCSPSSELVKRSV
jgi:hypothetical protein